MKKNVKMRKERTPQTFISTETAKLLKRTRVTDLCSVPCFCVAIQHCVNKTAVSVPEHAVGVPDVQQPPPELFSSHSGGCTTQLTEREIWSQ